jgi:hypothetical protein
MSSLLGADVSQRTALIAVLGLPSQAAEADILAALMASDTEDLVRLRNLLLRAYPTKRPRMVAEQQLAAVDLHELRWLCHVHLERADPWRLRVLARVLETPHSQLSALVDTGRPGKLLLLLSHCEGLADVRSM